MSSLGRAAGLAACARRQGHPPVTAARAGRPAQAITTRSTSWTTRACSPCATTGAPRHAGRPRGLRALACPRARCRRPGAPCAARALLGRGASAPDHGPRRALRQGGAALPARVPAGLPLAGADRPALEGAGALRPRADGARCERAARSTVRECRDKRARRPRSRPGQPRRLPSLLLAPGRRAARTCSVADL